MFYNSCADMTSSKRKWLSSEADGRIVRPRLTVALYDGRGASMTFRKNDFKGFPLNDKHSFDFEAIRTNPQYAYFDRTGYISVLESFLESVLLFLRPRRFGKSLFLSTLAHFHGVEHKQNYKELFQVCPLHSYYFYLFDLTPLLTALTFSYFFL